MFFRESLSHHQIMRLFIFLIFGFLLSSRIGFGQIQTPNKTAILQASLHIERLRVIPNEDIGKIQPGTPIKINVTVENRGDETSPEGELYVQYAFVDELKQEPSSIIFKTEKKLLPSIESGKKINIDFETPHQIPSICDFIRCDWSIREYQAIAEIKKKEHLLGTLALTFSAYYYPGFKKEFTVELR